MFQDILVWEKHRLSFNGLMFVTGIFFLWILDCIKPISNSTLFSGHFDKYYVYLIDEIIIYIVLVNILFTFLYILFIIIFKKNPSITPLKNNINRFVFSYCLILGIIANFVLAILELIYRMKYFSI